MGQNILDGSPTYNSSKMVQDKSEVKITRPFGIYSNLPSKQDNQNTISFGVINKPSIDTKDNRASRRYDSIINKS